MTPRQRAIEANKRRRDPVIMDRMARAGISTTSQLANMAGVALTSAGKFIIGDLHPGGSTKVDYSDTLYALCAVLRLDPEEVAPLDPDPCLVEWADEAVAGLGGDVPDPEHDMGARQAARVALSGLTAREERVARLVFGFSCGEHTLDEVGREFSVTSERIRQMLAKAIRKLQHPKFRPILRDYHPGDAIVRKSRADRDRSDGLRHQREDIYRQSKYDATVRRSVENAADMESRQRCICRNCKHCFLNFMERKTLLIGAYGRCSAHGDRFVSREFLCDDYERAPGWRDQEGTTNGQ